MTNYYKSENMKILQRKLEIKDENLDKKIISIIIDEVIKDLDSSVSERSIYQKISGKL